MPSLTNVIMLRTEVEGDTLKVYEGMGLRYEVYGSDTVHDHFIAMLNATSGFTVDELRALEQLRNSIFERMGGITISLDEVE
jgi:hypothetical protein